MFIPSSTINHHGSYANNILILVLILLYIRDFKINLLYIIIFIILSISQSITFCKNK